MVFGGSKLINEPIHRKLGDHNLHRENVDPLDIFRNVIKTTNITC